VRAIARCQRGHRLGLGLGERGLRVAHRRRDPGHPLDLSLGELLEVVGGIEGTISDQIGRTRRGLSLGHRVLDHLAELVRLTAMATQRWHQDRNAGLVLDHELQHHVVEVRPMIPAVASGDVHDLRIGLFLPVITAVDVQAGAIEVGKGRGSSQTHGRGGGHETVECRDPVVIEGIQGTTEGIIIELFRGDAGRHESRGGLMLEAPGDEIERLVDTPQAIEHHRVDGFPDGEVSQFRVLWCRLVYDVAHAKLINQARDEAKVIEDLTAVGLFHDLSSQEEILPPPKITHISSRVCGMSDVRPLRVNNRRLRYLSQDETGRLLTVADAYLRPMVITALHTGLRRGEMFALTWPEVDFRHGVVRVLHTKNGERREIPMSRTLRATLEQLPRRVDTDVVFPGQAGHARVSIRGRFQRALREAGSEGFGWHDLWHTFASYLVMAGVNLTSVKELMGHKTIAMTLRMRTWRQTSNGIPSTDWTPRWTLEHLVTS
jgi:integrase